MTYMVEVFMPSSMRLLVRGVQRIDDMALKVCSVKGCPTLTDAGRCTEHRRTADQARRADGNPYSSVGHLRFRYVVLAMNPICVLCRTARATVADHYPLSRRELIRRGLDPNDPQHGRGLCKRCHDTETAQHQPGGWNAGDR